MPTNVTDFPDNAITSTCLILSSYTEGYRLKRRTALSQANAAREKTEFGTEIHNRHLTEAVPSHKYHLTQHGTAEAGFGKLSLEMLCTQ